MDYNDILTKTIYLTKRNDVTQTEIGDSIGMNKAAANKRAKRNSKFKPEEIEKIERTFDIDFSVVAISDNSGERQNDLKVDEKSSQFGKRLSELQAKHNFLDREMATLLKISEKEYIKLVVGKNQPDLNVLNRIKQNFKVSMDYLLYGE